MFAQVGDRLVMASDQVGGRDRTGEVVDVRRPGGKPPYLVRWDHDGREILVFPGPQAFFIRRSPLIATFDRSQTAPEADCPPTRSVPG